MVSPFNQCIPGNAFLSQLHVISLKNPREKCLFWYIRHKTKTSLNIINLSSILTTFNPFFLQIEGQGFGSIYDCKFSPTGEHFVATDSHGHLSIFGQGSGKLYDRVSWHSENFLLKFIKIYSSVSQVHISSNQCILTRSLREPGGPCTKSMEVSESRMERVKWSSIHSPALFIIWLSFFKHEFLVCQWNVLVVVSNLVKWASILNQ